MKFISPWFPLWITYSCALYIRAEGLFCFKVLAWELVLMCFVSLQDFLFISRQNFKAGECKPILYDTSTVD